MQFNQLIQSGIMARLLKLSALSALLACFIATTGCTRFQFPGVYRLSIQQGNIITQEMVDQLKPGMTQRQVSYILGTPLIADSFQQDRWDYFYTLRDPKGNTIEERFTVYFKDGGLSHFTGDYIPRAPSESQADSAAINTAAG